MSILLTNFDYAPFNQIKNSDYLSSIELAIKELKFEIDLIIDNKNKPTFENTIEALDYTGIKLDRITSIFFNLNSAETNEEIQEIAIEISPILSKLKNYILLNDKLYNKINSVYNTLDKSTLTTEKSTLLNKTYKSFLRNGANLNAENKDKLRDIDIKLSKLSLDFGQNLLKETNDFELLVNNINKLDGLSDDHIEAAKMLEE